ncbi:MAG: hypothetical protein B7Z73_10080 [Planctomycetia bacterium 21-64-5]|nr:MAG: hypothetical protein B7Z73_10080 [Planctomycetia bacterium 21-64-5]
MEGRGKQAVYRWGAGRSFFRKAEAIQPFATPPVRACCRKNAQCRLVVRQTLAPANMGMGDVLRLSEEIRNARITGTGAALRRLRMLSRQTAGYIVCLKVIY